jgi:hypothetical protein
MTQVTRPLGTLKKLVDVGKKETRVVGSVERWILARPADKSRSTDVIHPSAMIKPDWCHRAEYYHLQGAEPAPPKYRQSMKTHLTFAEGHRIHARWQDWFKYMGNLYGEWKCLNCGLKEWGLSAEMEPHIDGCGPVVYNEVPVSSPEYGISGHADGWLKNFGDDLLLEIKSVGEGTFAWEDRMGWQAHGEDFKKAWASLKSPFYTHIMQAQVYMKLLELMNPDNHPKEAVFIYEAKPTQEVKEFVMPKSDFGVTPLFDAATMIMAAIDKQQPPGCNISPTGSCSKCEVFNVN